MEESSMSLEIKDKFDGCDRKKRTYSCLLFSPRTSTETPLWNLLADSLI